MNLQKFDAYQMLDSRGEPTLMVRLTSDTGKTANFTVPAGASRGTHEAVEKRDGGEDYNGLGVTSCIDTVENVIAPKFIGYPLGNFDDFDSLLLALDGTATKEKLGGNTMLAISAAYFKLSAVEEGKPFWQYIAEHLQTSPEFPRLFANVVGGGKHAPGLTIQEFMCVPTSNTPSVAIKQIYDVYHTLGNIFSSLYGPSSELVGDEGGLAPIGANTEVVLEALHELASKAQNKFDIALDSAANSFFANGHYMLDTSKLSPSELLKTYEDWNNKFDLFSIEDPFAEGDNEGLELIKTQINQQNPKPFMVVGDDFTVTNKEMIEKYQADKLFDAVIIKPNQVGTLSETFEAIKAARGNGAKVIISHRSGDTNDDLIADLAYGIGAMGLKLGAPARGERVAKYNRLLEIEADQETTQSEVEASTPSAAPPPAAT
jgi:enolase